MRLDLPNINQKIELKVLHGPHASAYSTYVEDVDATTLVVVRPTVGGELIALASGDHVRVEFAIKGSARIAYQSRVIGLERRVVPVIVLAHPEKGQVERFQQRDFVRLDARVPVIYTVMHVPPDGPMYRKGPLETYTRDISGNGAQLLCPEAYRPGTQLELHLDVAGKSIHVVAEVIRQVGVLRSGESWIGVRFIGIDERTRDQIIRFIFNEQRERRRMGLI